MIIDFLSHNLILLIITIITSMEILYYCQKVLDGNEGFGPVPKLICGGINGMVLFTLLSSEGLLLSLILLFGCPILVTMELFLFTKDRTITYFFLYGKLAMNFMAVFWIIAAIVGLERGLHGHHRVVMSFTLMITGSIAIFLAKDERYPMKELKLMVHRWEIGKIFFVYLVLGDVFLMISSILIAPVMEYNMIEGSAKNLMFADIIIKTFVILGFSYVLLFMQASQIRTGKAYQEVVNNLENERKFRSTVQRKGMMNLQINITRGILKEGTEFFKDKNWVGQKKFEDAIRVFAKKVVHPLEQETFVGHNLISSILDKLETNPYFSEQIRISPKEIIRYLCLPEETEAIYKKSTKPWMWVKIDYIYTREPKTGEISMFMVIFDVDEQVDLNEKLHLSASTDALTGLLNRTFMQYEIEKKLKEEKGHGMMILLDVDNFKQVNDKLGHPMGDEVLIRFSSVLRDLFRKGDVLGRLGGDEFAAFIPGTLSKETLEEKMKHLSKACRFYYKTEQGEEIRTSASIGIVTANEKDSYDTLYKKADQCLYKSKEKGKNTHTYYEEIIE